MPTEYKNTVQLTSFSVNEDSTPVDPSDNSGAAGQISAGSVEDENTAGLVDKRIDLAVNTQGITRGIITSVDGNNGTVGITADSRLAALVAERQAQPFNGTLGNAVRYLCNLVGISNSEIFIDPTIADNAVVMPGFKGNVWDQMKKFMVAQRAEISFISNNIVVRPLRTRIAENYRNASVGWTRNTDALARSIEIAYYDNQYATGRFFYPVGGWNTDVPVFQVNANQTVTFDIDVDASLSSVVQPVVLDYVASDFTGGSVYSVAGSDGLAIPAAQWIGQGGSLTVAINEDTRSLTVTIIGPTDPTYEPYSIAATSGNNYASLRLVGNGVFYNKKVITMPTYLDPSRVSDEVGTSVENEYINSYNDAFKFGLWTLKRYGSPRYTINVTTDGINRVGDAGQYTFPIIDDFNAVYAGQSMNTFNTTWAGKTLDDLNRYLISLSATDFINQAFGNIGGARVFTRDTVFRIRSATNSETGITYSAEEDATFADFNARYAGFTMNDFNLMWEGLTIEDFNARPFRSADA